MRARRVCGVLVLLMASTGMGFAGPSAHAQEAAPQLDAGEAGELAPKARAAGRRRARGQREARQEAWWSHAREVLFHDIELSPEQSREVDAIIEGQREERKRAEELRAELEAARQQNDPKRTAALRTELRATRAKLEGPHARIEDMRALLSEEQRPAFDMNRARLASEGKEPGQSRRGARAKRSGADAGAGSE